jgi:hypothetical protein
MPFVATAVRFPPPSAAFFHPNPLATGVTPPPATDQRRVQHKGMLLAVQRNSITNDDAAIVNGFGENQQLEAARSQVA